MAYNNKEESVVVVMLMFFTILQHNINLHYFYTFIMRSWNRLYTENGSKLGLHE